MLPSHHILESLSTHWGLKINNLTPLNLGADIHASTYNADNTYFIKLKQGSNLSATLLDLMHQNNLQHIISPINTNEGKPFLSINSLTITVYPFIEGQNAFSQNLTDEQWITLGKTLRKVHELKVPEHLIKKETYSPKFRHFVRSFNLDAVPLKDEWALKLQSFMKTNKETIDRLVNTAELLSQNLPQAENVLCHSDIHGGNVLIDSKGSLYIIDWDDPILAPKERDLMFIGGGVANIWNKPREIELFYQGYGKTKIDPMLLAYYRYERIIEDIAEYIQELIIKTTGDQRQQMYGHFIDMFKPEGVVDIAFKTYSKENHSETSS